MATPTASEIRLQSIKALDAEAERLLAEMTEEPMKNFIRHATRDLDEARAWLREKNVDQRPHVLATVDLILQLATHRLRTAEEARKTYGTGATLVGGDD
jgi:hypothetical protein